MANGLQTCTLLSVLELFVMKKRVKLDLTLLVAQWLLLWPILLRDFPNPSSSTTVPDTFTMGNRIVCCRQRWSQLHDSDEKISKNLSNVKVSYNNPAANFSGDVWRTSSSSGIHGAFDLHQISQEHFPQRVKSNVTQHIKEREPEGKVRVLLGHSRHRIWPFIECLPSRTIHIWVQTRY